MRLTYLLCALLLLPATLNAVNLSQEQRISEQLDSAGLQGTAEWLGSGDQRFLALLIRSDADKPLGGAILLHDAGDNADSPLVMAPLRRYLAEHGWDTLSLQLPRPTTGTSAPERAEAIALAIARVKTAAEFLQARQSTPLVLVGHGLGAEMALAYLSATPEAKIRALGAIGLSAGEALEDDPVIVSLSELELPILDLYGDRDDPEVLATAQARRAAAKRNERAGYRQDKVMGADHQFAGLQSSLQRRIGSWLRRVIQQPSTAKP